MSRVIVGVTGYKRSGKTAIANILEQHHGFKSYGFADALRAMVVAIDPTIDLHDCPVDIRDDLLRIATRRATGLRRYDITPCCITYNALLDAIGYERAKSIPDVRRFLQRLGTEGVRGTFGPDAWVNALALRISIDNAPRVVIYDVRFRSEFDWLDNSGGTLWRVTRPGVGGDDPHPSEREVPLLPASRELQNDDTLERLERIVLAAARADLLLG